MITSNITKKGQITIPASFRKKINTNIVKIEIEEDKIIIKPLKRLGGVFQKYARKDLLHEEVIKREKETFINAITEKHSNS